MNDLSCIDPDGGYSIIIIEHHLKFAKLAKQQQEQQQRLGFRNGQGKDLHESGSWGIAFFRILQLWQASSSLL